MTRPAPLHHAGFPVRTDDDDAAEAASIARGDDWTEDADDADDDLDPEDAALLDDDAEADEPDDGPV